MQPVEKQAAFFICVSGDLRLKSAFKKIKNQNAKCKIDEPLHGLFK
jgi:hypothetical protein